VSVTLLSDAKTYLNITNANYDAELQEFIDAAEAAIAKRCGPLSSLTVTERVKGCAETLLLNKIPALTLTSVTPVNGTALNLSDLYLYAPAGVVEYAVGNGFFGASRYDVSYSYGRSIVPLDLMQAIRETVKHLWETHRGGSRRPGIGDDGLAGAAYAFTLRILELIEPYLLPGMA
jgi:hypothetical protein